MFGSIGSCLYFCLPINYYNKILTIFILVGRNWMVAITITYFWPMQLLLGNLGHKVWHVVFYRGQLKTFFADSSEGDTLILILGSIYSNA